MTLQVRSVIAATREPGQPLIPVLAEAAPGWTPVFAVEQDAGRTVLKVDDWVGGAGTKPDTGYVGAAGSGGLRPAPGDGFDFAGAIR